MNEQVAQVCEADAMLAQSANEQAAQSLNEQVAQAFGGQVQPAFPPEPPAFLESCDVGESLSSGSFSRVSGVPFAICELPLPAPEFPADWDESGGGVSPSPDLQSHASQEGEVFRGDLSSPGPSWGSPISDASLVQERVLAEGSAESNAVAPSPELSKQLELTSHQAPVDDSVGSFVGSLVKGDVARFGSLLNGHKLPWENDFAKRLLDPDFEWDPLLGFKQDPVIPPLSATTRIESSSKASVKEASPGSIFAWAISLGAAARDPAAERERKLDQGVSMWSQLVMRFAECCSLHDCVIEGLDAGEEVSVAVSAAVGAAVGVKSPHSVHKRAASFWSFVRWLDVHEPLSASRLHEVQVWNYMQHLKATGAPATKASSVLSAFRFAHFVLGFKVDAIVQSKRIGNSAEQQLVHLRKLRQAKDLTVAQVLELHARLECGGLHAFDRAFLASLLIRLYARARPSDLLFIESVEIDCPAGADYPLLVFEVSQRSQHKGARKVQLKTRLLPILVPMIGVHGKCWVAEAVKAFHDAGRSLQDVKGPLTFAPSDESGVVSSRRSVTSAEVGRALRAFLGVPEEAVDPTAPRIAAYSLRGTCLGWGGKFGFDEDLKSVLGRHSSSIRTTQAIYSRELCAAPARRLPDMIREIAEGRFFPDNSRSSYFPCAPKPRSAAGSSAAGAGSG